MRTASLASSPSPKWGHTAPERQVVMRIENWISWRKNTALLAAVSLGLAGLPGAAKADPIGGPILISDFVEAGATDMFTGLVLDPDLTMVEVKAADAPVYFRVVNAQGGIVAQGVGQDVKLFVCEEGIYSLEISTSVAQACEIGVR